MAPSRNKVVLRPDEVEALERGHRPGKNFAPVADVVVSDDDPFV